MNFSLLFFENVFSAHSPCKIISVGPFNSPFLRVTLPLHPRALTTVWGSFNTVMESFYFREAPRRGFGLVVCAASETCYWPNVTIVRVLVRVRLDNRASAFVAVIKYVVAMQWNVRERIVQGECPTSCLTTSVGSCTTDEAA